MGILKKSNRFVGLILAMLLLFSTDVFAMYTTYQAKIVKPDGYPLDAANVSFRFSILDPGGSCILYTENFNLINMSGSAGLVSFSLGSGVKTFPTSGSVNFSDVFNNQASSLTCAAGVPDYTPAADDLRKIVMQFHDGSGWQTMPAMNINHVPYAMYARNAASATTAVNALRLNGKADIDFVQNNTIPTCSSAQTLQFNGSSFSCVTVQVSGVGSVVAVSATAPLMVTGSVSAPVISINVASMSTDGYLTAIDYAEFKAKLSVSATQIANTLGYAPVSAASVVAQIAAANLSGDVSGTPAANSVVTVGGKSAAQVATSVDETLAASSGNVVNALVKRDSSGNAVFNGISAAAANVNYVDIYKPSSSFNIRLQAPTSLSSNYVLSLPATSGTTGQVLSTDGAGNLSWIDSATGSVTSVSGTAGEITSSGGSTPSLGLVNVGVAGTYYKVTTDSKGRVTSGVTTLVLSDLPNTILNTTSNFAGDISGMISNITVNRIQGVSVTVTSLSTNDILQYDGAKYVNRNIPTCGGGYYLTFNGTGFSCALDAGASGTITALQSDLAAVSATANNALVKTNNLSDLSNVATARGNLGLGGFATASSLDLGSASATGIISDSRLITFPSVASGAQYTKVTVDGKGRVTSGAQLALSDVTAALGYTPVSAAASSQWNTSGTTINYMNGNVGIGTSNPGYKLEVAGNIKSIGSSSYLEMQDTDTLYSANPQAALVFRDSGNSQYSFIGPSSGMMMWNSWLPVAIDANGGTPDLYVSTSGNIGIGTANPTSTLEVSGGLKTVSDIINHDPGDFRSALSLTHGGTGTGYGNGATVVQVFENLEIVNFEAGYVMMKTQDIERMRITSTGLVGIGTSSPVTRLDVSGGLRIGLESSSCTGALAGTLRYSGSNVEYCNGAVWSAFGVAGTGITSLNGSSSGAQTFANGIAGNAPAFVTANGVHTLNIPLASAGSVTAGLISNADYSSFAGKITSSAASIAQVLGYVPAASGGISSQWNTSGTTINYMAGKVGIGTAAPIMPLHVNGAAIIGSGNTTFTNWNNYLIGNSNSIANQGGGNAGAINVFGSNNAFSTANMNFSYDSTVAGNSNVVSGSGATQIFGSNNNLTNAGVTVVLGSGNSATAVQANIVGVGVFNNVSNSLMIGANNNAKITILGSNGNVGIGTTAPVTKLVVSGGVRISMESAACVVGYAGTLRYNSGNVEFCNGSVWSAFGVAGAGITSVNGSTSATQTFAYGTAGTTAAFATLNGVHTLNIPLASAASVTGGLLSKADHTTFMNKITSSAASIAQVLGYVPASATALGNYLLETNNLSDLSSSATARANLGLGGFAMVSSLDLSTASATGLLAPARLPAFNGDVVTSAGSSTMTVDGLQGRSVLATAPASGQVLAYNGSAWAPYTVATSPWNTSGTTINYMAGNVGIGTSAPVAKLEVVGTVSGTNMTSQNYSIQGGNGSQIILKSYQDAGGNGSVYIGNSAGGGSVTGHNSVFNTVVGHGSYINNTAGAGNSIFGKSAAGGTSGSYNIIMGTFAAQNGIHNDSVLLGAYSGQGSAGTNMTGNVFIGKNAGQNITTGSNNTVIGYLAASGSLGTGSNNILIGYNTGMAVSSTSNFINIGNTIYGSTSTGSVGVGTLTPVTKLSVSGGLQISMESATCAANYAGTLRYNAGSVQFCNGTTWSSFGIAGAGITTFNGSASATQTFVNGVTGNAPAFVTANGVHTLNIPLASAAGSVSGGLISNADYVSFMRKTNNLSDLSSSATARVNLGLGGFATVSSLDLSTASATGILALARLPSFAGDVTSVSGSNSLTVDGLQGRSVLSTAPTSGQVLAYNGSAWAPGTVTSSQWNTSGTTINYTAGNVGVGTTSPLFGLHVVANNTNGFAAGFQAHPTSGGVSLGSAGHWGGVIQSRNAAGFAGSTSINPYGGNVGIGTANPVVALDVVGDIQYTGIFTDVSDRRLKTNIEPLDSALSTVRKIKTYSYIMKDDPKARTEFGVIAQDMLGVIPQLVQTINTKGDYYGVNYVGLIPWSIRAIQEVDSTTQDLKREIASLKEQNKVLEQKLEKILQALEQQKNHGEQK